MKPNSLDAATLRAVARLREALDYPKMGAVPHRGATRDGQIGGNPPPFTGAAPKTTRSRRGRKGGKLAKMA